MIRMKYSAWFVLYFSSLPHTTADYAVVSARNLALHKPTFQSTQNSSWRAVNGDYDDFTHTDFNGFNWWMVDLGGQKKIEAIKVYNRKDCCYDRLSNATILTSDVVNPGDPIPENIQWTKQFFRQKHAFDFFLQVLRPAMQVRYVAVTNNVAGKSLSLSEVEVFGYSWTTNVAVGKPSEQSHTWDYINFGADKATNGMYDDCANIGGRGTKWWKVDLQALYSVEAFRIHDGRTCGFTSLHTAINIYHCPTNYRDPPDSDWVRLHRENGREETIRFIRVVTVQVWLKSVRHLRLESTQTKNLILAEVEIFMQNTQTYRKPTNQSSTFKSYTSDLAVNGYVGDFTHTLVTGPKWWMVDLLEIYTVGYIVVTNRDVFMERLAKISLHLAKQNGVWMQHSYGEGPFRAKAYFNTSSGAETRYVKIISENIGKALSLAEVTVLEHNFAASGEASQSSVVENQRPENALDPSPDTHAVTYFYKTTTQWWRVKLIKRIFLTSVRIVFNKGECKRSDGRSLVRCTELSGKIWIKTSKEESPPAVTQNEQPQWSVCHSQDVTPFHTLHVECSRNFRHPITKHLSLQPKFKEHQLNLESCIIFGKQLPEFEDTSIAAIQSTTFNSFQLVFKGWDVTDIGAFPPTSYLVSLNGSFNARTIQESGRAKDIVVTWNDLQPDTVYMYSITCQIFAMECLGKPITGVVKTGLVPRTSTRRTTKGSTTSTATKKFSLSFASQGSSTVRNTISVTSQGNGTSNIDEETSHQRWGIIIAVPSAITLLVVITVVGVIKRSKSKRRNLKAVNKPRAFRKKKNVSKRQPRPPKVMPNHASQFKRPLRPTYTPTASKPVIGLRRNI